MLNWILLSVASKADLLIEKLQQMISLKKIFTKLIIAWNKALFMEYIENWKSGIYLGQTCQWGPNFL